MDRIDEKKKNNNFNFGIASPRFIAHSILGNLGYNYPIVLSPYIIHGIQFAILDSFVPEYIIQLLYMAVSCLFPYQQNRHWTDPGQFPCENIGLEQLS